jgi:hypothetical protein
MSILLCSHILAAFQRVDTFHSANPMDVIAKVKAELKLRNQAKNEYDMISLTSKLSYCNNWRTILQGQETGQWLPVLPSTVNGTELSAAVQSSVMLCFCNKC